MDPNVFGYGSTDLEHSSARLPRRTTGAAADHQVKHLEDRIDRLSLVCMAMWSLLQDKTGLTEEQLLERVRAIDLVDGVADGKATRTVARCRKCQRVMNPRHAKCLYCGAAKPVESAFDAI